MSLPTPEPGLVIRYAYLWASDHEAGLEEGRKDRPCAIVLAVNDDEDSRRQVWVLPVTHTPPDDPNEAIEIPPVVKTRLGLDADRSWIVITEWNAFRWPGPDLRRAPGGDDDTVAYGFLPPNFAAHVRRRFVQMVRDRKAKPVRRSE